MNMFNAVNYTRELYRKACSLISQGSRNHDTSVMKVSFNCRTDHKPISDIQGAFRQEISHTHCADIQKMPVRLHINDNGQIRKISKRKKANLIISGRMVDVCAEIDRLVALENALITSPHLH